MIYIYIFVNLFIIYLLFALLISSIFLYLIDFFIYLDNI